MKLNEGTNNNKKNNKEKDFDRNLDNSQKEKSPAQQDGFRYDYDDNF